MPKRFDSVWVGGTAVLLPALCNSMLAQQVVTLDRLAEGRPIRGTGIATDVANIRAAHGSTVILIAPTASVPT